MKVVFWDMEEIGTFIGYGGLYWGLRYAVLACQAAGLDAGVTKHIPQKDEQDFVVIGDQRRGSFIGQELKRRGFKYVSHIHGYLVPDERIGRQDYNYEPEAEKISSKLREYWRNASAIVAVSKGLTEDVSRLMGRAVWSLWNCGDNRIFVPQKRQPKKKLVAVGALIERKRPDRLNHLDFPVDLYGQDHGYGSHRRFRNTVNYRGPVDHAQLPKVLSDYKVFVHVAEREECPLVVIEALMMGLPVVGMDAGDMKDMVGPAGIIVPQGETKAMNEAVEKVLSNWDEYHRNALGRAERFTPEAIGNKWKLMFEHLMSVENGNAYLTEKQAVLRNQIGMPRPREIRAEDPGLDVSVVIPCYNMAHFLPEAIDSVLGQTFQNWEMVVVNDGSTDDIKSVEDRYVNNGKIRFVHQENQGLAEARNAGIAEAQGKWILPLDADDFLHKLALAKLVTMARLHPDSVIYGDLWLHYQDGDKRWHLRDYDFEDLLKRDSMPPCSLFPKQAWVESGGYKHLGEGYEDWEFWITLGELGYHGVHIRQPIYYYRMKTDSMWRDALKVHNELHEKIVALHPDSYSKINFKLEVTMMSAVPKREPDRGTEEDVIIWSKKTGPHTFKKIRSPAVLLQYVGLDPPHRITGPVTQKSYHVHANHLIRVIAEDAEELLQIKDRRVGGKFIFKQVR